MNAIDEKSIKEAGLSSQFSPPTLATYLINLDRSTDRLKYAKQQLEEYDISYTRFCAVDGAKLDITSYDKVTKGCPYYYLPLSSYEIACYQSHINTLKLFLEGPCSHALILEDDFKWIEDPTIVLQKLIQHSDYDIVKLYNMHERKIFQTLQTLPTVISAVTENPFSLRKYPSVSICNLAQVYTRKGAEKMIKALSQIKRPIDVELKHYWEYGLEIYSLYPNLVKQSPLSVDSTIINKKKDRSLLQSIKKQAYNLNYCIKKWWHYYC